MSKNRKRWIVAAYVITILGVVLSGTFAPQVDQRYVGKWMAPQDVFGSKSILELDSDGFGTYQVVTTRRGVVYEGRIAWHVKDGMVYGRDRSAVGVAALKNIFLETYNRIKGVNWNCLLMAPIRLGDETYGLYDGQYTRVDN